MHPTIKAYLSAGLKTPEQMLEHARTRGEAAYLHVAGALQAESAGNIVRLLGINQNVANVIHRHFGANDFAAAKIMNAVGDYEDDIIAINPPKDFRLSLSEDEAENVVKFAAYAVFDSVNLGEDPNPTRAITTLDSWLKRNPKAVPQINGAKNADEVWTVVRQAVASGKKPLAQLKVIVPVGIGWNWVDLGSCEDSAESAEMQHCGRDGRGNLISLRDPRNNPHVTMTYNSQENVVYQIKGKQNTVPVQRYWDAIAHFFKKTNATLDDHWLEMEDSPDAEKLLGMLEPYTFDSRNGVKKCPKCNSKIFPDSEYPADEHQDESEWNLCPNCGNELPWTRGEHRRETKTESMVREGAPTLQNTTAMVIVPGEPPGKNLTNFIRNLVPNRTKVIVVSQQGSLGPGGFEKLLRASMPDVEKKLRIVDGGRSVADAVQSAQRNRHYSPSQALEVYAEPQLAKNFSQEVSNGRLDFDASVIRVVPTEIPTDDVEGIRQAVEGEDVDAMHRALDPHLFSDASSLQRYKDAIRTESVVREFLTDIAPSRELGIQKLNAILRQELGDSFADLEYLGSGRNGSAYRTPDGLIVKVTTDPIEAESAAVLVGRQCEYIHHIHVVNQIDENVWVILQEGGLEKLPAEYCEEFDIAMEIIEVIGAGHALRMGDSQGVFDVMARSGHADLCILVAEVMRKFDVGGMLREVAELGLSADFHSGNIMLREGRPVLTDLGTPGDDPGDISETVLPPEKPWPDGDSFMGIKGQSQQDKYGFTRYRFAEVPHEVIVPAGLTLYHGTSAAAEFEIPNGPASFALDRKTAQGYADNEGEGVRPRVMQYVTTRSARCLDHPGVGPDNEKAAYWLSRWADENLGKGFTKEWGMIGYARVPDKLAIVLEAGFDGIVVRRLDDGGTEVCLFHPEDFVRPVTEQKGPPASDMQVHEAGVQAAPQAGPRSQMRGSNSSAWAGGRLVLSKPEQHVPEDENATEDDFRLDQDIVGGGLDWGKGLVGRGY